MVTYCLNVRPHATQSLLEELIKEMEGTDQEVVEFVKKWSTANRAST